MNTADLNELYSKYVEREVKQALRKYNKNIAEKWREQIEGQREAVIADICRRLRRKPKGSFKRK